MTESSMTQQNAQNQHPGTVLAPVRTPCPPRAETHKTAINAVNGEIPSQA
jgi:hypothetical protein